MKELRDVYRSDSFKRGIGLYLLLTSVLQIVRLELVSIECCNTKKKNNQNKCMYLYTCKQHNATHNSKRIHVTGIKCRKSHASMIDIVSH